MALMLRSQDKRAFNTGYWCAAGVVGADAEDQHASDTC